MITADAPSNASISLKSFFSKPVTVIHVHVLPPSKVFPTVPLLPLTQTTLSFTTLRPRRLVLVPEVSTSIFCSKEEKDRSELKKRNAIVFFIDRNYFFSSYFIKLLWNVPSSYNSITA